VKTKLLTIVIIVLVLLNVGTLGFLIYNGPMRHGSRHHGEGPKRLIIEKLHFDEQQVEQYEKLIHWHRSTIDALDQKVFETKNQLYVQLLKTNVDAKVEDSLINAIAGYQKQIEQTHFKHFRDIKTICKPNQIEYYNDLTESLAELFSKPKPPRAPHE